MEEFTRSNIVKRFVPKEIHSIWSRGLDKYKCINYRILYEENDNAARCHPNVIQFLGVYYPTVAGGADKMRRWRWSWR